MMTHEDIARLHADLAREDAKILRAKAEHGVWIDIGPDGAPFLYVAVGTAHDGAPLAMARQASPAEVVAWECGRVAELAEANLGRPVFPRLRRAGRLQRLWAWLKGWWA